jgi:hypothetical protein
MLIEFETPFEDLGGITAFDTDGADREDLVLVCVTLARAVERMNKARAEAVKARFDVVTGVGLGDTEERRRAGAIVNVLSGVDQATAVDALLLAIGGVVASDDRLSSPDINRLATKLGRKIAEFAHHFRKGEQGARH